MEYNIYNISFKELEAKAGGFYFNMDELFLGS